LVDDPGQAEEVVQEAFIRTFMNRSKLKNADDPLPYVRRAVVNLARSRLRRRRTERLHRTDARRDIPSAESTASDRARDDEVLRAIAELPRRQRECVTLRFYTECSMDEIAATLQISSGSVKQHLHRAIGTLGKRLANLEGVS
jgi:RNA polymerase sigma-70 factor (ECF subfamily)